MIEIACLGEASRKYCDLSCALSNGWSGVTANRTCTSLSTTSSTHTTPAVKAWLKKHPRVQFHFTPKGASWLNMVEAWFSLTRKSVRRGSFDSVAALTRHIRNYINHWNRNPTPFVWTSNRPTSLPRPCAGNVNMTSETEH